MEIVDNAFMGSSHYVDYDNEVFMSDNEMEVEHQTDFQTETFPVFRVKQYRKVVEVKDVSTQTHVSYPVGKKVSGQESFERPLDLRCYETFQPLPPVRQLTWSEVNGDLCDAPFGAQIAHCISSVSSHPRWMSKGVAKGLDDKLQLKKLLKNRVLEVGKVATVCARGHLVHNLVTKSAHYNKPTYQRLNEALIHLQNWIVKYCQPHALLCISKLGAGLDKLDWEKVKHMIQEIFWLTPIEIRVFKLDQNVIETPQTSGDQINHIQNYPQGNGNFDLGNATNSQRNNCGGYEPTNISNPGMTSSNNNSFDEFFDPNTAISTMLSSYMEDEADLINRFDLSFLDENLMDDDCSICNIDKALMGKELKKEDNALLAKSEANKALKLKLVKDSKDKKNQKGKNKNKKNFIQLVKKCPKTLDKESEIVNDMIKESSKVDVSALGNDVTHSGPTQHWKTTLIERSKCDKIFETNVFTDTDKAHSNKDSEGVMSVSTPTSLMGGDKFYYLGPKSGNMNVYNNFRKIAHDSYVNLKQANIFNNKSMFAYVKITVKKEQVNLTKVREEGIEFRYDGPNITIYLGALLDSGADLSYAHSSILDFLEPKHLTPDVNSTTVGVTGSNADVTYEKIAFPIIDRFGNVHNSAFRITNNNLGVEPSTPIPFVTEACRQLGIKQEVRHLFNFLKKPCKIRILLGLNNIFTFPKLIDPREFAGKYPVASPHLKVFHTNLSD